MPSVIQNLIMPNLRFGAPEEMYVRIHNDKVRSLFSDGRLLFDAGGRASLDTFFNSITVGVWKSLTRIAELQLNLRGRGRFTVRFGLHRLGYAHRWLAEHVVTLSADQDSVISVESWPKLESGMLYFSLEAMEPGSITSGHFSTKTDPEREVKLGIVITHFNRKQWVLPAIARIRDDLLSSPLYKGRIELVIVDNSKNITPEEAEDITLIPNKNLGGSGGFTRGLLHLKDQGDFTHCMFMDDDATCEIESILRAYIFMRYCTNDGRAIAGSLLRETQPHILFEKGALFDGICRPLKSGLNMCMVHDLLEAERIEREPMYGGWWFFGFPLSIVENYPFPFFVRGDDIRFSIDNGIEITTINGVACWGEDFSLKNGPLPQYLDVRYHAIAWLTVNNKGRIEFLKNAAIFIVSQLFSYNYASAKACICALEDVGKGPSFFEHNIDAANLIKKIALLRPSEKLTPGQRPSDVDNIRIHAESNWRKFFRRITMNGFFLPSFMLRRRCVYQNKDFRAVFREVFGYQKIYYENLSSGMGYVAEHNKKNFFALLFSFLKICLFYFFNFKKLQADYEGSWQKMTSEDFWRKVYSVEKIDDQK